MPHWYLFHWNKIESHNKPTHTIVTAIKVNLNALRLSGAYMSIKYTIIAPVNGLSPFRHQAIIWTNALIMSVGPKEHISILIQTRKILLKNAIESIVCEMAAILSWLNVLNIITFPEYLLSNCIMVNISLKVFDRGRMINKSSVIHCDDLMTNRRPVDAIDCPTSIPPYSAIFRNIIPPFLHMSLSVPITYSCTYSLSHYSVSRVFKTSNIS